MVTPLTCAICGAEVRHGVRDGVTAWLHREPVDHHTVLGVPYVRTPQEDREGPAAPAEPIPAPEVTATWLEPHDPAIVGGAVTIRNVLEGKGKGAVTPPPWDWWFTYARGPVVHGTTGDLLRIAHSLVLRARLAEQGLVAVASWQSNAKGSLGFDCAYIGVANPQKQKFDIRPADSKTLKAFLRGETL